MYSLDYILKNVCVFDYETKDPYIALNMGAGWTYGINHNDIFKGFTICASMFKDNNIKSFYKNQINNTSYLDMSEFSIDNETVICGQNLPYDIGWYLADKFKGDQKNAIKYLRNMYKKGVLLLDTKIIARLVDEHMMSVSLQSMAKMLKVTQKSNSQLAEDYWDTGEYSKDKYNRTGQNCHKKPAIKTLMSSAYSNLDKITPSVLVSYCEDDVKATYELLSKFISKLLKEYKEDEIVSLLKRYSTLIYLSIDMRIRGVPVHIETLREAYINVNNKLVRVKEEIMSLLRNNIEKADKEYMTKFLLQYYWHPKNKSTKSLFGNRLKSKDLGDLQEYWDKYAFIVDNFMTIIQEGNFDELKFSGSSPHPSLMFLLIGYTKDNFITTNSGRVSTSKEWIKEQNCDLGKLLNRIRKVEKMLSGFLKPAMDTQNELKTLEQEYGVVYPEFMVAGARTFRYSCQNPNLQQVPKRDPEFKKICRGMFHAPEGQALLASDFSSQEQRLQVHMAYLLGAKGSDKLKKEFDDSPNMDFHMKVAVFTSLICDKKCATKECKDCNAGRTISKNISLGRGYGMGEVKLCKTLGLPTKMIRNKQGKLIEVAGEEGKKIINQYDNLMPFIKDTIEILTNKIIENGFVNSASGRHIHCPYYIENFKRKYLYHKLFNYVIQGSAADQLHLSLINLYDYICNNEGCGFDIIGTVHDENLIAADINKKDDIKSIVENSMINAIKLEVPVIVDTEIGKSWLGGDL